MDTPILPLQHSKSSPTWGRPPSAPPQKYKGSLPDKVGSQFIGDGSSRVQNKGESFLPVQSPVTVYIPLLQCGISRWEIHFPNRERYRVTGHSGGNSRTTPLQPPSAEHVIPLHVAPPLRDCRNYLPYILEFRNYV
ncbi:hypothetical protein TNCV_2357171 [Trichonephila clavipes]|nr:hypothetical protein TNCV_2357171 [Trichonephila clavipes]